MTKTEILEEILRLEVELEKVKAREIPDMKRETRVVPEIQSDGSTRLIETTAVWQLGDYEKGKEKEKKNEEIRKLQKEIKHLQEEYKKTPEYDVVNSKDKAIQEKQKELETIRLKEDFDAENKDLNDLIVVLKRIGLRDLTEDLSKMPLANKKMNSSYVKNEIEIQDQELRKTLNRATTRREYREIKSRVKRLTKNATKMAKKYSDLSYLVNNADRIMSEIRELGIEYNSVKLAEYFEHGIDYHNVGHMCLRFYYDPTSAYARDRKKIPFSSIYQFETNDMLDAELKEIDAEYKDVDELIRLLYKASPYYDVLAGIANNLYNMRFVEKDINSQYMKEHIKHEAKRRAYLDEKPSISEKELKEIKKQMKLLSKKATRAAKKHKALYKLHKHAFAILEDIKSKNIENYSSSLCNYFSKKYTPGYPNVNLGYIYTEFARDYDSEYAKDSRNHRI